MSRILRRPMFRGGGKVSSYGNGIASGMGYAGGGRVGYEPGGAVTGGNIIDRSFDKFNKFIGNTTAINPNTNKPYTAAETQAILKNTRGDLNMILNPFAKLKAGQMLTRAGINYAGLPSASRVKDFFTKSPQSASKELGAYKGPAPFGTDRFFAEKLRPMFQNTGAALKDVFGGAGKLKDYKTAIGVGGVGGGFGLTKLYEGFKERQKGAEADVVVEEGLSDMEIQNKKLQEELYNLRKKEAYGISEEQSSPEYKETVVDKKARLKEKAKEYEDILGAGIKKDSIFDAMIEGGTRLFEGQGVAESVRAANKALDPIQNVRTASRKLALEEDIAINKALAVAAAKDTETAKKIRALKEGGYTPRQIADALAGKKDKDLPTYVKESGPAGYMQFVNDKIKPESVIVGVEDIGDIDTSKLKDGIHYIKDAFVLIEVKGGRLKGQPTYLR